MAVTEYSSLEDGKADGWAAITSLTGDGITYLTTVEKSGTDPVAAYGTGGTPEQAEAAALRSLNYQRGVR